MADYNPYAAGQKVYNGGSSAATSGAVDPTGYIDRSLNNPGYNKPSYTPQVAQAALNNLRDNNAAPVGMGTQSVLQAPVLRSSPTGGLTYNPPSGLTLDPDLQSQYIGYNSNLRTLLANLDNANQNEWMRAVGQERVINQNYGDTQRRDLNSAAFRGMARSSGYADQVDRSAQAYTGDINSLIQALQNVYNQNSSTALGETQNANDQIANLYAAAAQRASQQSIGNPTAAPVDPNYQPPLTTIPGAQLQPMMGYDQSPDTSKPSNPPNPISTTKPTPVPKGNNNFVVQKWEKGKSYKMVKGETLDQVAKRYGTTVQALMKLNGIRDPKKMTSGNTIRVR